MATRKRNVQATKPTSKSAASAPGTGAQRQSSQRKRLLGSSARTLLLLTAFACFAFVAFDRYQAFFRRGSIATPAADVTGTTPKDAAPKLSQDELAQEKAKFMKKLSEQFEKWKPTPSLPFVLPTRDVSQAVEIEADVPKRDAVKAALTSSWAAYVQDAWGADEYHPISHTGSNLSTDGGIGYTIVDTLDVLLITGQRKEYRRARDWVKDHLSSGAKSWERRGRFNVFETTIRTLGGLLSAHALCSENPSNIEAVKSPYLDLCDQGDAAMFLDAAGHLANQLHPAFDTATGVPKRDVDFFTGEAFSDEENHGSSSLAEATTVQLEFKYLSFLTDDASLWRMAERPMQVVRTATKSGSQDGLLPIMLSHQTGRFYLSPIRLGSRGDSYYEYLIKQYLQTNRSENVYRDMWDRSVAGIKKYLVKQSTFSKPPYLFTAEILPLMNSGQQGRPSFRLLPKQDHLVCFLGGSLMLGAHEHGAPNAGWPVLDATSAAPKHPTVREEDWALGHELLRGCMATYQETSTGLSPEIAHWRTPMEPQHTEEDWYIKTDSPKSRGGAKAVPLIDARNILRPETVESLFVAHHLTGDPIYREWGWEIFRAFEKHCKLSNGAYAGIKDVDPDDVDEVEHEDKMETFWLSETLKYLYLLFDDQKALPLDKWVFNTEAHPLPIFAPKERTSVA
ncbi:unnamed protein product [Parajaminaea phylloscopi]